MRFRWLWLIRNGFWKWWYDRSVPRWTRWVILVSGLALASGLGLVMLG